MKYIKITFWAAIAFMGIINLNSCYYDVETELYPNSLCDTAAITYSTHIVRILQNNCYICHSNAVKQGDVSLEGYTNLKPYVDNGLLIGVVRHDPGFLEMPQGGAKIGDCEIAQIQKWINDGAPNN